MATGRFLLYGANGYTGSLIARMAAERGMRPILAGRDGPAVAAQAAAHGCEQRVFRLEDSAALDAALAEVDLVLHCAGPFARTARPMADGCLRARAHYLDITGEFEVFEALARRDAQARAAGVMFLPGAGFDVVPSDCLAAHLKRRLPGARRLALAFQVLGRASRGTMLTALDHLDGGGMVRRDGALVAPRDAPTTRAIDFGRGPVTAVRIPWGDISTAFYSTGIPNIDVYAALSRPARLLLRAGRPAARLLATGLGRRLLGRLIGALPAGPSDAERARGSSLLWGEVVDAMGRRRVSRLRAPESYTLTAHTALAIVERALAGRAPFGFQTPARAYGADFILEVAGVTREDIE